MLTIKNIDKLLAIISQNAEVLNVATYVHFYEFTFRHDHLNSELVYIMQRTAFDRNTYKGDLVVDGGKPHRYDIEIGSLIDPFRFLKFLDDMTYDWDICTNK